MSHDLHEMSGREGLCGWRDQATDDDASTPKAQHDQMISGVAQNIYSKVSFDAFDHNSLYLITVFH